MQLDKLKSRILDCKTSPRAFCGMIKMVWPNEIAKKEVIWYVRKNSKRNSWRNKDTLQHFVPSRLGHGVRSIEDPALLEHLRQHQIHLEVCPTCNVQTNVFDTYADHPIDRFRRVGISVGVHTDTRTITNITLSQEYEKLHQTFGWDTEDFFHCNRNALKAAFVPDNVRKELIARLVDGYQRSFWP